MPGRMPFFIPGLAAALCLAVAFCLVAGSDAAAQTAQDTMKESGNQSTQSSSQGEGGLAAMAAAAADSAKTETSVVIDKFKPYSSSVIRGGESDISLGSMMSTTIKPNIFWTFTNQVSIERRRYRTRNMEDVTKSLTNTASWLMPEAYLIAFSAGENYTQKKTLGLGRYGKDIIFDNENASLNMSLLKKLPGTSETQLAATATGRRGQNDFKYDKALAGGVSGRVGMRIGEMASIGGGLGGAVRRESSKIGAASFGPFQSFSDTISFNAFIGESAKEKKPLIVNCTYVEGTDRGVTAPKGNYGEILANPALAKAEKINQRLANVVLTSYLTPFPYLSLDFKFNHAAKYQSYLEDPRLSSVLKSTLAEATTTYSYASGGSIAASMSSGKSVSDIGQTSISSYSETERKLSARLSQAFSKTFSLVLGGGTALMQRFYAIPEKNPRDVDVLNYSFDGKIASAPFEGVTAGIDAAVTRRETINIDKSLSRDNRTDWVYNVSPNYSFRPRRWISLSQNYQLRFEYNDFTYNEAKNYLNRSTTLKTNASFTILPPIVFSFVHTYLFKDSGNYRKLGNERLYSSSTENIESGLSLGLDYMLRGGTTAWCDADFRNQQSNRIGVKDGRRAIVGTSLYESSGLRVGFSRKRSIGADGELDLNIVYNRRFGPNLDESRRKFWDVNAGLKFNF